MLAGDILFFASSREWGECAFCSAWVRSSAPDARWCWRFNVLNDIVRVPISSLHSTAVAHIGSASATVICPPMFLVH